MRMWPGDVPAEDGGVSVPQPLPGVAFPAEHGVWNHDSMFESGGEGAEAGQGRQEGKDAADRQRDGRPGRGSRLAAET